MVDGTVVGISGVAPVFAENRPKTGPERLVPSDFLLSRGEKTSVFNEGAEGVGFEPTVPLQARRFSRPVP